MTEGADSDEALMLRYAAGEAAAFEELYRRHGQRVWRFLKRGLPSAALADELLQDVWFAVAREAAAYRPVAKFTTWLYTLARNRHIDWLRSARREHALAATGEGAAPEQVPDTTEGPRERAEAHETARAVLAAVEQLPAEQREAFVLQADGEFSVEDIARMTGVTFETAKSRLRYARTRLKQLLLEYA